MMLVIVVQDNPMMVVIVYDNPVIAVIKGNYCLE
jgi:hypothetical protein